MKNVKTAVIVGVVVGLSVLGVIVSRPKPHPIDETAQLLSEGEQAKLELQKKLSETKLTTLEMGKRVFNESGWQVYLSQFNPEYKGTINPCMIEMDQCEGWQVIAAKLGVDQFDVKYAYYYAQDVNLTVSHQIIYDAFQALVRSVKPQTAGDDNQIFTSFATNRSMEPYELKAILAKGSQYKYNNSR